MRVKIIENLQEYPCLKIRDHAYDTDNEGFIVEFVAKSTGTVIRQGKSSPTPRGYFSTNWMEEVFIPITKVQLEYFKDDILEYQKEMERRRCAPK